MMTKLKTTPLELDDSIPKELSSLIENKWHYCLKMEKRNKRVKFGSCNDRPFKRSN